ncbi:hypothetical protein XHV734_1837 [Xanthomonas hortorum pv. vitians]|nr:hypothetical protein XHV734_1837 [Xanthomonas hortorum pv. vitians]
MVNPSRGAKNIILESVLQNIFFIINAFLLQRQVRENRQLLLVLKKGRQSLL